MSRLILKSVLGLLFLDVVLALALFLPAGSTAFWQAWVFLAVWTVCVIVITGYLMKYDRKLLASRVQAGPIAESQKFQQLIQGLAGLFFIGLFIVPSLDFRFHWSTVPPWLSGVANGFVTLGFLVVFLVFRANTYTSATIEVSANQTVISSGPYRLVRHPMYSGALLLLIFVPVALGSWVALPGIVPLIGVIVLRLIAEERFLLLNLAGYDEYCHKVRYRLIPFIW
jgi:protein-S-isoprenylcysteine O-methyltransferase Ste14